MSELPAGNFSAEEVQFHLDVGAAISELLPPIERVLALQRVSEQHGWIAAVIPEYREMLETAVVLLTKLGELSAVIQRVHQHNLDYVKTDSSRQPN